MTDTEKIKIMYKMYCDVLEFCDWKEHGTLDALLNCMSTIMEYEPEKKDGCGGCSCHGASA